MASEETAISQADCERQDWQNARPCFVLSTGRSGTLMLTRLLESSQQVMAVHQPRPELIRPSKLAYEHIAKSPDVFREVFKSAREEYLLDAMRRQKTFVETNNRITFFAPVIKAVFPRSVFIHLVRHPGDFVRSGIRRGWYSGTHDHDIGRIIPTDSELTQKWPDLTQIERIAWLWNETNRFIEEFKTSLPPEEVLLIRAEDLFAEVSIVKQIFDFLHLGDLSDKAVSNVLKRPANVQKKGAFPPYASWKKAEKRELKAMAQLSPQYGYEL